MNADSGLKGLFRGLYTGKRVFVTGHTGFKGSWLCEWLLGLGAEVTGYSLKPPTRPALFEQLGLGRHLHHIIGDIRDLSGLTRAMRKAHPDFVFHLAAQPIVRDAYASPVETFEVNLMGTVHVLEALRPVTHPCAAVFITTDKCYENREWVYGYREDDPLGGHDPYSASKAAVEMAIGSYRRSFFQSHPVKIASARAGNVIGGGDWATDRIVPDCIRALAKGQPIPVRNPKATRPWQHVLEPLSGYLWLGACLSGEGGGRRAERYARESPKSKTQSPPRRAATINAPSPTGALASAFNFGPGHDSNRTVEELVTEMLKHWPGRWEHHHDPKAVHEANLLQLVTNKANALLGWSPVWGFPTAVEQTVVWYRAVGRKKPAVDATSEQIHSYCRRAAELLQPWAGSLRRGSHTAGEG